MTKKYFNRLLIVVGIAALVGFGVNAFAGWGMGYGHHGWGYHHGPGWHHRDWEKSGYGYRKGDVSEEEYKKLDKARRNFISETENLRQNLYAKELELRSELAKQNPDTQKAAEVQSEISKLEAELNQKRIDHMIKMRKLSPNIGSEYMSSGGYGPGYCW